MISITDKLHKLYALELAPVVWARSAGLDVLNELTSLKGAIMSTAGGERTGGPGSGNVWTGMAHGVETVTSTLNVARSVAGGLGGLAIAALRNAVNSRN
jgi:ubiquinone biosynthesis monooxygenase Coq6